MQALISSHSEIVSFPESHFFPALFRGGKMGKLGFSNKQRADQRLRDFATECGYPGSFTDSALKYTFFVRDHVKAFRSFMDSVARKEGAGYWLEKTPRHLWYIDRIKQYIPDAKFIHLIRNGADTALSMYRATNDYPSDWSGPRSIVECAQRWEKDLAIHKRYLGRSEHFFVTYQSLIDTGTTGLVVHSVCDFIGVDFQPSQLTSYKEQLDKISTPNEHWKSNVTKSIEKKNKQLSLSLEDQQLLQKLRSVDVQQFIR